MGLSGEALAKEWIARFQGQIYNYVRRMVGNDADASDLTQDIFAAAFQRRDSLDSERDPGAYLYRIATHAVYRHFRSRSRRLAREQSVAREDVEFEGVDPVTKEMQREEQRNVQESLAELPEELRGLLLLHYYNGLTTAEIARVLDKPRSTIRDRLRQALDSLSSALRRNGHAVLIPQLEAIMRGTPPLEVPAALSQSLQELAATAPAVTASGSTASALTASAWTQASEVSLGGFPRDSEVHHAHLCRCHSGFVGGIWRWPLGTTRHPRREPRSRSECRHGVTPDGG